MAHENSFRGKFSSTSRMLITEKKGARKKSHEGSMNGAKTRRRKALKARQGQKSARFIPRNRGSADPVNVLGITR